MPDTAYQHQVLVKDVLIRVVPNGEVSNDRNSRAVVFLHGFLGSSLETWQTHGAPQSFPSLLASDPQFLDHDFFLFQYVTKNLHAPAIDNIAVQLSFVMKEHFSGYRVIFIAHSMGGLVAMRCILRLLEEGGPQSVAGLLLFGCPMTGVEWANYAQSVLKLGAFRFPLLGWINHFLSTNRQVEALRSGSQFIDGLSGNWILRVLNGGHPKVPAAQRAWFPVRVVTANDDWVVKESSARGFYSEIDWINADKDHRALVKPTDRSEFTYQVASNFLRDCRTWLSPAALFKLRQQIDSIWDLHYKKTISDWKFEVLFDADETSSTANGFGVAGFRSFNVLECSYQRRIESPTLKFGFAVGAIAARALWNDQFGFLHSIRFGGMGVAAGRTIQQQLRAIIQEGEIGWSRLFTGLSFKIRRPGDEPWYQLRPGQVAVVNDGLVRDFSLPEEILDLVGKEAVVEIRFRSLLPSAITDYAVEFPWLCDAFVVRIGVKGEPAYLIASRALHGSVTLQTEKEEGKIEISSQGLILPGSYIQFEWGFD